MNVDATPFVPIGNVPSNIPLGRPEPSNVLGGGVTAVVAEFDRPVVDTEQAQAGRENNPEQNESNAETRRDASELAAQLRLDVAREESSATSPRTDSASVSSEPTITADERQLPLNNLDRQIENRFANDPNPLALAGRTVVDELV